MVNREMTRIQHITYAAMKYYAAVEALDPIASEVAPDSCYLDVSTASFMLVTNVAMYPMNRCSLGSDACLAGLKTRLEDAEESLMDYVMGTWPPTPVDYDQSAKFYEHIKKLICHALDEIREAIGLLN